MNDMNFMNHREKYIYLKTNPSQNFALPKTKKSDLSNSVFCVFSCKFKTFSKTFADILELILWSKRAVHDGYLNRGGSGSRNSLIALLKYTKIVQKLRNWHRI